MSPNSSERSQPDVGVLIAAGGRGDRAGPGEVKQFRAIAGVPMLLRAVRPFAQHPRVHRIVVALPAEEATPPPPWLADLVGDRFKVVSGGDTRQESVRCCLAALDRACSLVLVHDAARPFVTQSDIDAVLAAVDQNTGAILAVPVSHTLKRADDRLRVTETVSRRNLWQAQTPQGFPRDLLERAYREAAPGATDDAALIESCGGTVVLVPGPTSNIKVTTPEDFALAEALAVL